MEQASLPRLSAAGTISLLQPELSVEERKGLERAWRAKWPRWSERRHGASRCRCVGGTERGTGPRPRWGAVVLPSQADWRQAALRLTWLSAIAVSFLSVAFSSSSVCCSKVTQSLRPSSFAHEISVP